MAIAAAILFWGIAAYWVYLAVQWLGFGDQPAYWSALITIGVAGVLFYSHGTLIPRGTLTTWALTLMGWVLIAVIVLVIGFVVLAVIITPPSLYSLVVIGVFLLAAILWQLTKLTSKR